MMRTLLITALSAVLASCAFPAFLGPGNIRLSVTSAPPASRTLAPTSVVLTIDRYTLTLTGPLGTLPPSSDPVGNFTVSGLVPGTWTAVVQGFQGAVVELQGKATVTLTGPSDNLTVALTPQEAGGTGSLTLSAQWPASYQDIVEARGILTPLDALTNGGQTISALLTVAGNTALWSNFPVPVGLYRLSFQLTGPGGVHAWAAPEAVWIYPGVVTTGAVTVDAVPGLSLKGKVQTFSGIAPQARIEQPEGLYFDAAEDKLYTSDGQAGADLGQTIRRFDPESRTFAPLAGTLGTRGSTDGFPGSFRGPLGMARIGGSLFVADSAFGTIRKVDLASGTVSTFATGFSEPVGIATDGYTLWVSDFSASLIYEVSATTGATTVIAGDGSAGWLDDFGTAAEFQNPRGLVYAPNYNCLWVADSGNGMIRKIDFDNANEVTTVMTGRTPFTLDSIVLDPNEDAVFVSEMAPTNDILHITAPGGYWTEVAGVGNPSGNTDGPGWVARFNNPMGLAVDVGRQRLYVADEGNNRLRFVDLSSGDFRVSTISDGGASPSAALVNGPAGTARFQAAVGAVALGSDLFVLDNFGAGTGEIRRVRLSDGTATTLTTGLDSPWGITTDGTFLYVTGSANGQVWRVDPTTGALSPITSLATVLNGIVSDGMYLYVSDVTGHRVVKLSLGGAFVENFVTTADGLPLDHPADLTTDGTTLFLYDASSTSGLRQLYRIPLADKTKRSVFVPAASFNSHGYLGFLTNDGTSLFATQARHDLTGPSQVLQISLANGRVSAVAGSAPAGFADGWGPSAGFTDPAGIASDGQSLYVVDSGNNTIRVIR